MQIGSFSLQEKERKLASFQTIQFSVVQFEGCVTTIETGTRDCVQSAKVATSSRETLFQSIKIKKTELTRKG